ncbi:hypothetical protein F5884DRAFT_775250 [Xylogone sp. PMI_703]|nr:hypothetical protein F5884DRAFT_775250 [Xylogone sp. PMI_703]
MGKRGRPRSKQHIVADGNEESAEDGDEMANVINNSSLHTVNDASTTQDRSLPRPRGRPKKQRNGDQNEPTVHEGRETRSMRKASQAHGREHEHPDPNEDVIKESQGKLSKKQSIQSSSASNERATAPITAQPENTSRDAESDVSEEVGQEEANTSDYGIQSDSNESLMQIQEDDVPPLLLIGIGGPFLNIQRLQMIERSLDHYHKDFDVSELDIRKKPRTAEAIAVGKQLRDLFLLYERFEPDHEQIASEIHSEISEKFRLLSEKTNNLLHSLTYRSRPPSQNYRQTRTKKENGNAKELLEDLYCVTIRQFVILSAVAATSYAKCIPIEDEYLEEVFFLIGIAHKLAETATGEEGRVQPKARESDNGVEYEIQESTKMNLGALQLLKEDCERELQARHQKEKKERKKILDSLRVEEKKRKAEAQMERDRRHDLERFIEGSKIIAQVMADKQWSKLLSDQFKLVQNWEAGSESESVQLSYDQNLSEPELSYDRDANEEEFERVQLFEENNTRQSHKTRPLSDTERLEFIEYLRNEKGPDRYEKLAEKLDRSLDDIFMWAKDLQETMNDAHAKGKFTAPEDFWTYRIWVEQDT